MKRVKIIEAEWVEEVSHILCIAETLDDDAPVETAFTLTFESFGVSLHEATPEKIAIFKSYVEVLPGNIFNIDNQ